MLKFPYGFNDTIYITLNVVSPSGLLSVSFLFDTGADITSFPTSVAKKLMIDLDKCPQETMTGFEGTSVLVYKSEVKINFNNKSFIVPCVFNPNEEIPSLLGRAGILSRFNILLNGKSKEITFEEI